MCLDVFLCHRKSGNRDTFRHRSTVNICNFISIYIYCIYIYIYIIVYVSLIEIQVPKTKRKTEAFWCGDYILDCPLFPVAVANEGS